MKLSTRLHTIFDMVQPCGVAADTGCDHDLLPITLIRSGKCEHVYVCDVRKGPLSRIQEAIRQYGLQSSITTKLCDGLQGLEDDVGVVVIVGMGYDAICRILMKGDKQLKHYEQIILQCNIRAEGIRRWLHQNGFIIDAEQLTKNHHHCQMLSVHKEPSDMREDQYLPDMYLDRHPLFKEYWIYILEKQRIIIQHTQPYHDGYAAAAEKIKTIEGRLGELDQIPVSFLVRL